MEGTLQILVVAPDSALEAEFDRALQNLRRTHGIATYVKTTREAVEAARSRRPEVVCVPMTNDVRDLTAIAEELAVVAPEATVVAVYRPESFGPEQTQGGIIIDALRAGVKDFIHQPISAKELEQLFERLVQASEAARGRLGAVLSFISNKGGVGKSTLAVNTACAIARNHPERVLLIDASTQMGVCASMLNLVPRMSITDAVRELDRLDETLLRQLSLPHASGLRLLAAPKDAVEAAEVTADAMSRILSIARRAFDHVIVDTFPIIDNVVMTILDMSDRVYVTLHGAVPTVLGSAKLLEVLFRIGVPSARRRVVLNQNHEGFSDHLSPVDIARKIQSDIHHVIPYQPRLSVAVNTGEPLILGSPRIFFDSAWWKATSELAEDMEQVTGTFRVSARARSLLAKPPNGAAAPRPVEIPAAGPETGAPVAPAPAPLPPIPEPVAEETTDEVEALAPTISYADDAAVADGEGQAEESEAEEPEAEEPEAEEPEAEEPEAEEPEADDEADELFTLGESLSEARAAAERAAREYERGKNITVRRTVVRPTAAPIENLDDDDPPDRSLPPDMPSVSIRDEAEEEETA